MKKHLRRETHKMELFKDPSCSCDFCTLPNKSDVVCAGHIPYPILQQDDSYSLPNDYFPIGTAFEETDCPSTSGQNRVGRYHPNRNRINNSTLLAFITCYVCGKDRGLYGSRRHVPKEFIDWIVNTYAPDYQFQCGETLFPNNSSRHVKFPVEDWHNDRCLVEVRHKLYCSSPIEVQVSLTIFI